MANPVCLSPLKFYDTSAKQEHRKSYAFGHIAPVVMPFNTLYPFQFVIEPGEEVITAYILNANTGRAITNNIYDRLLEAGLSYIEVNGYKLITFPGVFPLFDVKYEGLYYIEMHSAHTHYVSEVFCFTSALSEYMEIEYWNPEANFALSNGVISFDNNFRFKMLIHSELGKPEYNYEEEATKRLGYNFIESQVSKKIYKFTAILPEYQCDAMRLIRLCSNKMLTCNGETFDMLSFDMDVEWQEQGNLASVTCEFEVDNIIVNIGGFKYEKPELGDFNNDFNNDFNVK